MPQSVNPSLLITTLRKTTEIQSAQELRKWLDDHLPYPSPKSRKRVINYILGLLELRDSGEGIKKHPLVRLFPHLKDEKTERELVYWQVMKKLPYMRDFSLYLSQTIERKMIPRQEASEFVYSLMGKKSVTTLNSLLYFLDKFNLLKKDRRWIYLDYYSPARSVFAFALCDEMLRQGRVTMDLTSIEKENVVRLFFMSKETALLYLEEGSHLWQIERRPPLNRILLLVNSLDEVVDFFINNLGCVM